MGDGAGKREARGFLFLHREIQRRRKLLVCSCHLAWASAWDATAPAKGAKRKCLCEFCTRDPMQNPEGYTYLRECIIFLLHCAVQLTAVGFARIHGPHRTVSQVTRKRKWLWFARIHGSHLNEHTQYLMTEVFWFARIHGAHRCCWSA